MPVTRRSFIGLSAAALAAFTLDPDRLLWRPGAKTFFLPVVTARPTGPLFWYVNRARGGDGLTPDTAMSSLADAVYAARSGDTIIIAPRHVEMVGRDGHIATVRQSNLNIIGAAGIRAEFSF